jgi:hypothetical protein
MKKRELYRISMLVAAAIITVGCSGGQAPAPAPKPMAVVHHAPVSSGTTLANLKSSGVNRVSLKGNPSYKQGSAIRFIVNTMGKSGYLYIVYVDNKGETGLLYPNAHSPLTELSGEYLFPRDFGNMNIRATKDCGDCPQEKTTVYALLSKEPITDINNITKAQLISFAGGASQSKGLSMTTSGPRTDNGNLNVGKLEFIVQ